LDERRPPDAVIEDYVLPITEPVITDIPEEVVKVACDETCPIVQKQTGE